MKKCYVVADFFYEEHKRQMRTAADECGVGLVFFDSNEEAHGRVSDGEIIYCNDGELLTEMPRLEWCQSIAAGAGDFLKRGVFDSGNVLLTNSSGSYGVAISEHIMMVTLLLMRRMPDYFEIIGRRGWQQNLEIRSIYESVIAIVGTGDLGQNAAKRYKALGAKKVIGFSRGGKPRDHFDEVHKIDEYEEIIGGADDSEQIDVLLLCIPGTPDTEGLISRERFAMLPRKTILINVGRGPVIDQEALIEALNDGRIAGAALDVVYPEPLPEDHPLWTAKNCIITPHISGDNGLPYTTSLSVDIFCDNLKRYTSGKELTHIVDIKAGY